MTERASDDRLLREMEHDRLIADKAEEIWNWDSPAGRTRAERRAGFFVEHASLAPGRRALEIGCGTGLFLERAARSGAAIVGMDLSNDLLRRASARVRGLSNVRLCRGDAHRMPYPDASFDAVYGSSILHHLDLVAALREAKRVLRSGGLLVFTEPNILNPQIAFMFKIGPRSLFGLSPDEMAFSRRRAMKTLATLEYVEASVTPFDFVHPAIPAPLVPGAVRLGQRLETLPIVRSIAGSLLIRARRG